MFSLTDKIEQLDLVERVSEINNSCLNNPKKFLELLKNNFEISVFIPPRFYNKYYSSTTNNRSIKLESILAALLIANSFHISNTSKAQS